VTLTVFSDDSIFEAHGRDFLHVLGPSPRLVKVLDTDAHEGPVYCADEDALYFTTVPRHNDVSGAPVDDRMRATGVAGGWLYAVGDCNGRALFTHMGKYQARIAADVILGRDIRAIADHGIVPRVTFTDPQVCAVGLTEEEARDAAIDVRTIRHATGGVAGASVLGTDFRGTSQLVVDQRRRVIVGATFVGPGVQELLHAATVAIAGEVTLDRLWHAVPAFPTVSEVWLRLLETYGL
jgi:dihydrolipoamide dehydrogenase